LSGGVCREKGKTTGEGKVAASEGLQGAHAKSKVTRGGQAFDESIRGGRKSREGKEKKMKNTRIPMCASRRSEGGLTKGGTGEGWGPHKPDIV